MNEILISRIVSEQANDVLLWFPSGDASRVLLHLQDELRRLHAAIEGQEYYIGNDNVKSIVKVEKGV